MIAPVWGNEGPGYGTRASHSCHDFWQENAFSQGDLLTFNGAYPTQGYSRHFAMLSTPQVVADLVSKVPLLLRPCDLSSGILRCDRGG